MRRISLAMALLSAMATGCGVGSKPASTSGEQGTAGIDFDLVVNNQGPGTVTDNSVPVKTCAPNVTCKWTYPSTTKVVLTAAAQAGNYFNGWFGGCSGTGACTLSGQADKYVVSYFSSAPQAHPTFNDPTLHEPAFAATVRGDQGALNCGSCHGANLQGLGIAVACTLCHQQFQVDKFLGILAASPKPVKGQETCASCHAGDGPYHQSISNKMWDAPKLATTIGTVAYNAATQQVTVNFSLTKNGQAYAADITKFAQKTVYVAKYDRATRKFGSYKSLGVLAAGTTAGSYTAKNDIVGKAGPPVVAPTLVDYDPTTSDAFVYVYFAENPTVIPAKGNYKLYDDVASAAVQFKATAQANAWSYVTAAPSTNCEKCHPAPYMKHGYRAGAVPGIQDMVACKACHGDARVGSHPDWQVLVTDPLRYTRISATPPQPLTAAELAQYAYVASVMNDTHMSHAMEFAYPQSMANCVTCHEGRLAETLTDANFTIATCKSCHPLTKTMADAKRAPPLYPTAPAAGVTPTPGVVYGVMPGYHNLDANGLVSGHDCNACHADDVIGLDANHQPIKAPAGDPQATDGLGPFLYGKILPLFKDVHSGLNKQIYAADGTKYAATVKMNIDAATFDPATNILTVDFSASGAASGALIKPTVVISLYGFDTKDFIVGGHASQPDGKRNLEWAEGATNNSPRLTVQTWSGGTSWRATANLTTWATAPVAPAAWKPNLADGSITKAEIGILPTVGLEQTAAVSATNPAIAVGGVTRTFQFAAPAGLLQDASVYGKAIVSVDKCNKCHGALGLEFHSPSYGSAGVVACRLCHIVGSGGSHLEMQSRSIDSYVHALHSMQVMDVNGINFADPVAAMKYGHHIESTYPKFTTLDCESCHNPGTYDVPDVKKSLPGVLSASSTITGKTRAINGIPSVVTGPAARACGACHRSEMIKEDDATKLLWFNEHTGTWGYRETNATGKLEEVVDRLFP
jgi:OmcA/MtrC family decaheme c-type cytochrome